ncbi:MAG: metallophosphoesterase [Kiritimatiellae bacterium]|nr:metallophosphoesterase [Kiritimatiellia bacterium]
MNVSRMGFLKSALSALGVGVGGGWRVFAAPPGWKPPKNPNLVFGAVSDTHLAAAALSGKPRKGWIHTYFRNALSYFRDQNVDAVVHCGDLAHRGMISELQYHANVWKNVFPGNRAPDGHVVEKLFVNGNHDTDGWGYGSNWAPRVYPDPAERAKHVLSPNMAGHWERIWGEPFHDVWHKEVKGYHFFGRHHGVSEAKFAALVKAEAAKAGLLKSARPFFMLSHKRPSSALLKALRPCRNAVGFFGHWHHSCVDWNAIYFFKGASFPNVQVPSCEPRGSGALGAVARLPPVLPGVPIEGVEDVGKTRQGYVVRVYDDMLVISRREFGVGGSLGPDWIMPLGRYKPHPLSFGELAKRIGEPQFRDGAKLGVEKGGDGITLSIPLADANPESRVYAYDVKIAGADEPVSRRVFAVGCNLPAGREPNGGVTKMFVPAVTLPCGDLLAVSVTPYSSLGTKGRPISALFEAVCARGK